MPLLLSNLLTRVSSLTGPLTTKEESDHVLKANSFHKKTSFIESQIQTIRCPKVVTAVACCPKKPRTRRINAGRPDCGEDAYFTLHTPSNQLGARILAMGIGDGVGGYNQRGVDPSEMSWALMNGLKKLMKQDPTISCYEALEKCYFNIVKQRSVGAGASTACVVALYNGGIDPGDPLSNWQQRTFLKLTAANIGDSVFIVIRENRIFYKSKEQVHSFNCPYQLAVPFGPNSGQDLPKNADVTSFRVYSGDVIILCSDGLTDNVFESDIVKVVSRIMTGSPCYETNQLESPKSAQENFPAVAAADPMSSIPAKIATELLKLAFANSRSKDSFTPFAKHARENNYQYTGGKSDDISLQVAVVI
jgi:protein phosphatase PTC7